MRATKEGAPIKMTVGALNVSGTVISDTVANGLFSLTTGPLCHLATEGILL